MAQRIMFLLCLGVLSIAFFMVGGLLYRSHPVLAEAGLRQLLFSIDWRPTQGHFGMAGFIAGSLWVTAIAIFIAVPLSILTATYLSEYAHRRIREWARPIVDLLAGISPVVYGAWGVIAVVPLVRDYLMPFLSSRFPFFPFVSENYTGYTALTGGLVLSIMIFPIVISIIEEVMKTIPREVREAALALGATKWQMVKHVVFKKARPGIIAAVILGLSRAFGETMAVLMVAGCCLQGFPKSIFDPAYPLPALIANTYGEMMSIPLFDAAVLLAALVLLLVTIVFNVLGWLILLYFQRKEARYG
jgi:phosphate transport system permease protein